METENSKVSVLIIGAGVIGSSAALHLAQKGVTGIRVIDFDLEGSFSSSELNAGGVRATWNEIINIEMAKKSIDYFSENAVDVGYKDCGYLWLHPEDRMKAAQAGLKRQMSLDWPVEVLSITDLKSRFAFIDKTEGVAGAIFSRRDGLINPNLLKNHYRTKAKALGVVFDDRTLLREVECTPQGSLIAVAERFESVMSYETKLEVLEREGREPSQFVGRSRLKYKADKIINCAGPWAPQVAKILGYPCPSYPLRRQVSIFDCRGLDLTPYGMIVDTSGVYFHPEATNGLAGFATSEKRGISFQYDGESFFEEFIWPALYERSTHFEKLKHLTGWAGLYEVSPDECAIIGFAGGSNTGSAGAGKGRIFEAHSFSGHGVMHSYAAGLGVAELLVHGRYETLDLTPLSSARFEKGAPLRENLII